MNVSVMQIDTHASNEPKKDRHTLPKTTTNDYRIARTHLIDGIYQGFVNASYQRDGFGILQTDDFQTYIGYFKYNRPNGLGLIVYTDGSMIYANFKNGELQGIGLADNGIQIQIGTFKGVSLVGIGFEYTYKGSTWKMNSYHKGVSIQVIKEQTMPLEEGVPNFIAIESEILSLFLNYHNKKYFSKYEPLTTERQRVDINEFYVHKLSNDRYFFGSMIQNQFYGVGLVYDVKDKKLIEVGTYLEGILQGYGITTDQQSNLQQLGFFVEGKKEGVFFVHQGDKIKFHEFKKNNIVFEDKRGETLEMIKKAQRIYYYRQKDFLSTRNGLNVYSFRGLFESSEYKAWKIQQQKDSKQQKMHPHPKPIAEAKAKPKAPANTTMPSIQGGQKSSLTIMKEKIIGLMAQNENKKAKNSQKNIMLFHKQNNNIEKNTYEKVPEDDQIAAEENPIVSIKEDILPSKKSVILQKQQKKNS